MSKTIWSAYQTPMRDETWCLQIGAENPDTSKFASKFYPWSGIQVIFSKTASMCLRRDLVWEYTILPRNSMKVTVDFLHQPNGMYINIVNDFLEFEGPGWPKDMSLSKFREFINKKYGYMKEIPVTFPDDEIGEYQKAQYDCGHFATIQLCG